MIKRHLQALILIGTTFAATCAWAEAGVTLKAGTLGFGAEVTLGVADQVNARAGFNVFGFDLNIGDEEDTDLETSFKWQTFSALLDWYPGASDFRLSAGLMINNNGVDITADTTEPFEIDGNEYTITDLSGSVGFNGITPYIGLGYGDAIGSSGRVSFAFDLGVMFQGAPDVSISATTANPAQQALLNADLEEEAQNIEDDTSFFKFYPVLSMGVSYSF